MIQKTESAVENVFPETPDKSVLQQQIEAEKAELCGTTAKVKQYIDENPSQSILIGLGVGIGAGLLLGAALQRSSSLMPSHDRGFSEKISANIKSTLAETLPDFMKKHFPQGLRS
ncbi:hypothetical protein Pla110_17450 [Polystyrenella longa]|uniref:YtxH-like protein n=1 Tax=Polystyrenella longa TaxID=2528007 RepID=A0A518CLB8_9PLAN|nr:hypothetical protein [Polystyrenella longa]QDU80023.1 hypothetical protein Pla110_17450 [Polystyrenella longa]